MKLRLLVSLIATSTCASDSLAPSADTPSSQAGKNAPIGENCENPSTKWDIEACPIRKNTEKYQPLCMPAKVFPNNATSYSELSNVKGIIIMYHGFSACPDATKSAAALLQSEGFVVLSPLTVGHGVKRGYNCNNSTCVGKLNENPSFLPTSKEGFITWLDWSLEMVKEEVALIPSSAKAPGFFVGAHGLSLGGALATASASRPSTPIQKVLLANPFLSVVAPDLDFKILKCQTVDPAEQNYCLFGNSTFLLDGLNLALTPNYGNFTMLVELVTRVNPSLDKYLKPNKISAEDVFNGYAGFLNLLWETVTFISETPTLMQSPSFQSAYGWGARCEATPNRGGFCNFKVSNLLAMHAFGAFAFGQSPNIPSTTEAFLMFSERDGISNESMSTTVLSNLAERNGKTSMCTFHISCDLKSYSGADNQYGVPHSMLSEADNRVIKPFINYWQENMLDHIVGFFSGKLKDISSAGTDSKICSTTRSPFLKSFKAMGPSYLKFASNYFSK